MRHLNPLYQDRIVDSRPAELGGIPKNEPVFLLRATDIGAPAFLRAYATTLSQMGADPDMLARINAHADRMEAFALGGTSRNAPKKRASQKTA